MNRQIFGQSFPQERIAQALKRARYYHISAQRTNENVEAQDNEGRYVDQYQTLADRARRTLLLPSIRYEKTSLY